MPTTGKQIHEEKSAVVCDCCFWFYAGSTSSSIVETCGGCRTGDNSVGRQQLVL